MVDKELGAAVGTGGGHGGGAATARGLAPQGPAGEDVGGEEVGAAAPLQEQQQPTPGAGKQPANVASEKADWMRGVRVTQMMGVGYVPLVRPGEGLGGRRM